MRRVNDDELETLTVSQASRITKLSRATIAKAMNLWTATRGGYGLRFVQPNERRLVRRSELLRWFEAFEQGARYA